MWDLSRTSVFGYLDPLGSRHPKMEWAMPAMLFIIRYSFRPISPLVDSLMCSWLAVRPTLGPWGSKWPKVGSTMRL